MKNSKYNEMIVEFIQSSGDSLTGWELSNLLKNISTCYYKNELINELIEKINDGVKPRNIIIMDSSFKYDDKYNNLFGINLNKSSSLEKLYRIGQPTSMKPNNDIYHIAFIFELFEKINKLFYNNRISKISKGFLTDYINSNNTIKKAIKKLKSDALNCIKNEKFNLFEEESKYELIKKKIEDIVSNSLNKYNIYEEDRQVFSIKNISYSKLENKYPRIKREYYMSFFNIFNKLSRPVIGVYNQKNRTISILGLKHINRSQKDEEFFDIKKITHNSPMEMIVATGIGFSIFLKCYLENRNLEASLSNSNEELDDLREENEVNMINLKDEVEEVTETEDINSLKKIKDEFLKENIKKIEEKNIEKNNDVLDKYEFLNSNIEITYN
ncbi:hypothetical protein JCM16358_08320 [Halanaerocella petrolearia]